MKHIQDLKLEVLTHLPYSPQLTSSGIHFFRHLKDTPRGHHFRSDEVVTEVMHNWPAQQPKDFVSTGIYGKLEWV